MDLVVLREILHRPLLPLRVVRGLLCRENILREHLAMGWAQTVLAVVLLWLFGKCIRA